MMFHVKVSVFIAYHVLLVEFGELPILLHALKLTMSFQQQLAHLSPSWLVSKVAPLSQHLVE